MNPDFRPAPQAAASRNTRIDPLAAAVVLAWLLFALLLSLAEIQDPDLCFHIAWGRILGQDFGAAARITLGQDPGITRYAYSYWVYQMLVAALYHAGPAWIVILRAVLILVAFLGAACLAFRQGARPRWIASSMAAAILVSQERFLDRPELFSLLFWIGALAILLRSRESRGVFLLLPLQAAWANFHPWFGLLPALWVVFCVGERLDGRPRSLRRDAAFLGLLLVAGCLTPAGPKAWLGPLAISRFLSGEGGPPFRIAEMMSPYAAYQPGPAVWSFRVLMPLAVAIALAGRKRIGTHPLLALLLTALLAGAARRAMPLFAVTLLAVVPPACEAIRILPRLPVARWLARAGLAGLLLAGLAGAAGIANGAYFLLLDQDLRLGLRMTPRLTAWGAARFLAEKRIAGPIFHNAVAAGPILLENGTRLTPYLDARWEAAPEALLRYKRIRSASDETIEAVWDEANRDIQAVILDFYEMPALLRNLALDPRWAIVYQDETAVVYCRRNGVNQPIVREREARLLLGMAGPDASRDAKLGQAALAFLQSRRPSLLEKMSFPFEPFYRANYALQLRRIHDAQVAYLDLLARERGSLHWSRHRLEILNNLVYCLAGSKETDAFAALLEAVASDRSTSPAQRRTLRLHRARALERLGRAPEAEVLARGIAAETDATPDDRWAAWCRVASLRAGAGDYQQAAEALTRAARERPTSAETYRSLASILDEKLVRPAEALAAYEMFLKLGGQDPGVEERVRALRASAPEPAPAP